MITDGWLTTNKHLYVPTKETLYCFITIVYR